MKHKLLNKLLVLTLLTWGGVVISPAWATDYTTVLSLNCANASKSSTSSEITTTSGIKSFLETAANVTNKLSVTTSPSKVYGQKGSGGSGIPTYCMKVGTASGSGSFSFTIDNSYDEITRVVITGYGWKTSSKIAVNGSATQSPSTAATETTFTFDLATASRTISINVTSSAVCITNIELQAPSASPLASIALSGTYPTTFNQGDAFSHEGMTVTATYEDDSEANVTGAATFTGYDMSTIGDQTVTVSYTEGVVTKTATYDITVNAPTVVATPTMSVAEGTYNVAQSVELSCLTDGATIRYTTDGTDPTLGSTAYSSAITVDRSMTLKAKAFKGGLTDSEIASATYTLKCVTPTITVPSGVFVSSKVVTITSSAGASIYYTTDGSTPTTGSTLYDPSNKPSISATTTVSAIAVKDGWSYSDVASETFTKETVLDGLSALVAKTNTSDQSYYVELSDAQVTYVNGKNGFMEDDDAGIYIYNASPTLNKVYNGIFQITYQVYNNMPELKAITAVEGDVTDGSTKAPTEMTASALSAAFDANLGRQIQITGHTTTTTTVLVTGINFYTTYYNPSFEKDHIYTIVGYPYNNNGTLQFRVISAVEKPDAPNIEPSEGEFSTDFTLTLSAVTGATIRYTTDGSTPTASLGSVYDPENKPTISTRADVTVKAVAILAGMTSDVASVTYEYSAISKPTFDPADGTALYYGETVAISSDVDGATIYYTTNGNTPTSSSSAYSDPIAITTNMTIKAMAKKGEDESSVASASYTLKAPVAPNFDVAAGAVAYGTELTISSATGTTLKYTTDGSDPSSSGTATAVDGNSKTIAITAEMTIKAIALDGGSNKSSETSAAYTIQVPAAPTFDVAAGSIAVGTSVTITGTGTIRYTTNGVNPTSSTGEVYSAPVSIDADCTLKAICVDGGGNASSVTSAAYTVFVPISGYSVDFEADIARYTDWTMTNISQGTSAISAHGGTYYGQNTASTLSIKTATKVAEPDKIEFYVSKTSNNTTSSNWVVQVSSNGSDWTQVGAAQDATSMDKGSWTKVSRDLTAYTDVYVRIYYSGSTAVRAIDDISLSEVMPVAAPEFSVASGIYTVVKSVEITCATEGATIYYTTNGDTPTSSSSEYTSALSIDTSCTLKAIAIKGEDQSNVSTATYVINLPTHYNLATEITSGKHYVIASGNDGTVQVMTDQNSTYRNKTSANVDTNVLTATGACEVIIQGPDADSYYTIYDAAANGYLYASSSSSNNLNTQSTIDNNARWSISIDGTTGVASIVAQGSNSRNTLQYNSGSPRFTCYSSAGQTAVYLFEKDGEATPTESVTVGSTGYTTYTTTNAVSLPVGVTAYIVTAIGENSVTLAEKTFVPARTPVIIKASADSYDLTSVVSPDDVTGNLLLASDGTVTGGAGIYALAKKSEVVGFYPVDGGVTIPKGKAYLNLGGGGSVKGFTFEFEEDEADGIESIQNSSQSSGAGGTKFKIQNEDAIFNLAGQRVDNSQFTIHNSQLKRGIYIVNGKKIAIK